MWPKDVEAAPSRPAIESYVEGDKFCVRVDMPGIDPKEIDIKVAEGVLTVKGAREEKTETKKPDYFRREIRYGAYERSVALPEGIKGESLKATYRNGVLELCAPMPKEATPAVVKIPVEHIEPSKVEAPKAIA
jgi:HSP20 family protein